MVIQRLLSNHPELTSLFADQHYREVKTIDTETSLEEFLTRMFCYSPRWLDLLFFLRSGLARLMGLQQGNRARLSPAATSVSFVPGEKVSFFTVRMTRENVYWFGKSPEDKHLSAILGVVAEQVADRKRQIHVITLIHYKNRQGPLYFRLITPFHHLIVNSMMRAADAGPADNQPILTWRQRS
jgi:hypothetical protein